MILIGINKTEIDNHKIIIAIAQTERWLLSVNHKGDGIKKKVKVIMIRWL